MFPRVDRVKSGGKVYEYLRIIESYRGPGGKGHHRVVANLGRLDAIGDQMEGLIDKLRRFCPGAFVHRDEVATEEAVTWGQILVIRKLWEELGLGRIIERLCQGRHGFDVAEHAFVLVANRLCKPKSEHGLARWLDSTFVCDRYGQRFLPEWLSEEQVTREHRVKVRSSWLATWYRTLDAVYGAKQQIEKELFLRLRDLFHLQVDLVFYDLTTLYFERREPKGQLRRHGSMDKDGKFRNVKVLLGLVMVNGFPLASHVFAGNRSEKKTVPEIVDDLRERFGVHDVVFVADRGISSAENRELLSGLESYHYLFAHRGRRDSKGQAWLHAATDRWHECGGGTRVQEVPSGEEAIRAFIVESDERKEYERALRKKSMQRAESHLRAVAKAVAGGRLKKAAKIGARAARALQKDKGHRYFSYSVDGDGQFDYWEDEKKLAAETIREGRYVLTTDHDALTGQEAVQHYKELNEVEDSFRNIKDLIEGRPVFHKIDRRVCAHLFFAHLALLLICHLRRRLEQADLPISPRDALEAAQSLGVSVLDLNGQARTLAAGAKRDCRRVLNALDIQDTQPPRPGRAILGPSGSNGNAK
jgi:transposase